MFFLAIVIFTYFFEFPKVGFVRFSYFRFINFSWSFRFILSHIHQQRNEDEVNGFPQTKWAPTTSPQVYTDKVRDLMKYNRNLTIWHAICDKWYSKDFRFQWTLPGGKTLAFIIFLLFLLASLPFCIEHIVTRFSQAFLFIWSIRYNVLNKTCYFFYIWLILNYQRMG